MNRVCILGSINMDLILRVDRMPKLGETIFGSDFKTASGGKGANQAVAAKRLGSEVFMIGKVGADNNGKTLVQCLVNDDINTDYVFKDETSPTGTALVTVNSNGDNSIVVVAGANMTINSDELEKAKEAIKNSDVIIAQFETPEKITAEAFKYAKQQGKITILNPAPVKEIDNELLEYTDIIIPNETEAFELTGVQVSDLESAKEAAKKFIQFGVTYVVITLGEKGAALITKENAEIIPAYRVEAVDTTAAGDSFIGGVASKLKDNVIEYKTVKRAIEFGNKVSSIVVQRLGAQPSIPYLEEILNIYGEV